MKLPSCRDRLEQALEHIADPAGEGARACLTVYAEAARAAADAADARSARGMSLGPLDGVLVSIKDLFDVAGEPTRAGSKILAEEAAPAAADAVAVQRLRAAGAVIVAKTNMTEFAFSGIGANPHFGTPGNPHDRKRVPGGSSSGAPVTVADGMSEIAIGTDTGAVRAGRLQAEPAARADRGRISTEQDAGFDRPDRQERRRLRKSRRDYGARDIRPARADRTCRIEAWGGGRASAGGSGQDRSRGILGGNGATEQRRHECRP